MKVFILEDDPQRMLFLRERLFKHDITHIDSCVDADKFTGPYDLILLDHDLGGRQLEEHEDSGTRFAELVASRINYDAMVIVHSYNPVGAARMGAIIAEKQQQPHDYVKLAPFRGPLFIRLLELAEEREASR